MKNYTIENGVKVPNFHTHLAPVQTTTRIYTELTKAQDKCFDADAHKLFDLCQYHIDIVGDEDLNSKDNEQILKFAKDVYKIAKLTYNLNPLV